MKIFKKTFAFLLTLALLAGVALPHSVSAAVDAGSVIPDGEYPIVFRYLKDGTTDTSAANGFMVADSGKLIVSGGQAVLEHEVAKTTFTTFAYLGSRKPGAAKATIVYSGSLQSATGLEGYEEVTVRDAVNPDNVVVRLAIEDIWKKQDVVMHIDDKENIFGLPIIYNNWYNAQLQLFAEDITLPVSPEEEEEEQGVTQEQFDERLAEGYALHEAAVEGNYDGTYKSGSKAELYGKLQSAEELATGSSGDASTLDAAYNIAAKAIKAFKSSIVIVEKARLIQWIETATEWVQGKTDRGEAESGVPSANHSISDGEYLPLTNAGSGYVGPTTTLKSLIASAQTVTDNTYATQAEVNAMRNDAIAKSDYELFDKQRVAAYDVEIMVLDSIGAGAQISPHAGDISPHAAILQQAGPDYYNGFANFIFYNTDNTLVANSIRQTSAAAATGGINTSYVSTAARVVSHPDLVNAPEFLAEIEGEHADTVKVYQSEVRSANRTYLQTDELWQGLWRLQYPMALPEAQRKTVFISFNKAYLASLQSLIEEAEQLHDGAGIGAGAGQHSANQLEKLQAAIDEAGLTAEWLAAPRPTILSATSQLQDAIDAFEASVTKTVYFSAVDAAKSEFSRMNAYFQKPALVSTNDDGSLQVTLTITGSSSVPEFKVKQGGLFTEATNVSSNEAANTRVVTFKADSLDGLLDAQVRTVVPSQNYDVTHAIRLNFNDADNVALIALIQTAKTAYSNAASKQGLDAAKAALLAAIVQAESESVRVPAQQSDSDAALQALQTALSTFNQEVANSNPGTGNPGTGNPDPNEPAYPANGFYYVDFRILKDNTDANSMAYDYVVSPALVEVKNGSKIVKFTVKQSNEIKSFTIGGKSESVASRNTKNNTRVVSFTLTSLTNKLNGTVRIDWDAFNYHHTYDIQFLFDESSAIAATESKPSVPGAEDDGNVGVDDGKVDEINGGGEPTDEGEGTAEGEEQTEQPGTTENPGNPSLQFTDTANHWAKNTIEQAIKLGIVNGYNDGTFRPNGIVTRAEFAVMVSRALQLEGDGDGESLTDWSSVPAWAQPFVARVVAEGIISGYEDQTFRSGNSLTRTQLAVMIARAAKLELSDADGLSFADAADVPVWARKEVAAAVKAGFIQGKGNNTFDPNATATRAEALTLIMRLLEEK
ncbi:NEAT domain-containing protein [Paenibacillus sp. YIM B09110]|uniref:NEAT domain-containing protein n=1 Tax=Paenibacillus sp. YIM B09110 TaxID=3126102 RepID=UPI00301B807E